MPRPASRASSIVASATVIQKIGSKVVVEKVAPAPIAMGASRIPVIASACAQREAPIRHASSPVIATSAAPASEAKVRNRASDCKPNSNSEMRATKGMTGG